MAGFEWSTIYYAAATISLVAGIVMTLVTLRLRKEFASKEEVDKLDARLNRHHERMVALETIVQHLPSEKGFHELALAMKALGGDLGIASERITGVMRDLGRIEATITRHEDILSNAARSISR